MNWIIAFCAWTIGLVIGLLINYVRTPRDHVDEPALLVKIVSLGDIVLDTVRVPITYYTDYRGDMCMRLSVNYVPRDFVFIAGIGIGSHVILFDVVSVGKGEIFKHEVVVVLKIKEAQAGKV